MSFHSKSCMPPLGGFDPDRQPSMTGATKPKIRTLVMIRHGETDYNKSKIFTGWFDVDVNLKGKEDCRRAGMLLAAHGFVFDVAYTSLLKRAIRSTWALLAGCDQPFVPVKKTWMLNERHYGALQGLSKPLSQERLGPIVREMRRSWDLKPPDMGDWHPHWPIIARDRRYSAVRSEIPRAESLKMCSERVCRVWEEEIKPLVVQGQRVVIMAHGNSLRSLIRQVDGITDEQIKLVGVPNAKPIIYRFDENMQVLGPADANGFRGVVVEQDECVNLYKEHVRKWDDQVLDDPLKVTAANCKYDPRTGRRKGVCTFVLPPLVVAGEQQHAVQHHHHPHTHHDDDDHHHHHHHHPEDDHHHHHIPPHGHAMSVGGSGGGGGVNPESSSSGRSDVDIDNQEPERILVGVSGPVTESTEGPPTSTTADSSTTNTNNSGGGWGKINVDGAGGAGSGGVYGVDVNAGGGAVGGGGSVTIHTGAGGGGDGISDAGRSGGSAFMSGSGGYDGLGDLGNSIGYTDAEPLDQDPMVQESTYNASQDRLMEKLKTIIAERYPSWETRHTA